MKKNTKKKNKQYTLLIIPQNIDGTRRLNFSSRMFVSTLLLILIFISASALVSYLLYRSQGEIKKMEALKAGNVQQKGIIRDLNEEIDRIELEEKQIYEKQEKIKELIGIATETNEQISPSRGGQSGLEMAYTPFQSMDYLEKTQCLEAELDKQKKEIDQLLDRVTDDLDYYKSIPNQWPVTGDITSYFGMRSSPFGGGRESFHNGLDIANNVGTDITAVADGTVIMADWYGAYGRTVIIDHGHGYKTMYGHNCRLQVKKGDKVSRGQTIAQLGSTGRSTGPHLHFTIFKNDTPMDPLIFLPD